MYKGFSTALTIEVVRNRAITTCPKGHEYYLNNDGSDPGCPICAQETEQAEAVFYFETTYTGDIMDALYEDGIYHMERGDFLTVTITVRTTSVRTKIINLFKNKDDIKKPGYTYGGRL
jgi:hypothetical protein